MILRFLEPNSDSNKYYTATLNPGKYLFSAWGASGGGDLGGKGGFTSAVFAIKTKTTFYIYVGGCGSFLNTVRSPGGYNGGGEGGKYYPDIFWGGGSGGGATDIRTVPGNWDNTASLGSRIIVAGAGGGACGSNWQSGGYGGGLTAGNSEIVDVKVCIVFYQMEHRKLKETLGREAMQRLKRQQEAVFCKEMVAVAGDIEAELLPIMTLIQVVAVVHRLFRDTADVLSSVFCV